MKDTTNDWRKYRDSWLAHFRQNDKLWMASGGCTQHRIRTNELLREGLEAAILAEFGPEAREEYSMLVLLKDDEELLVRASGWDVASAEDAAMERARALGLEPVAAMIAERRC